MKATLLTLCPPASCAAGAEPDVAQGWQVSSDGKSPTNSTAMSGARTGVREMRLAYRRAPRADG